MRLLKVCIQNIGVFQGRFDFDLTPLRDKNGNFRHLTIINGHNGAGKSTLFQALSLGLYGSYSLGNRTSKKTYNDFLLSRLHHYKNGSKIAIVENANICLSFEYVQSGTPLTIEIQRSWKRTGKNVVEKLEILQNGETPKISNEDFQIWLNELIPPGIARLCFFDAEQLDTFANPDEHNRELNAAFTRLLGLDLIEQLTKDLDYYVMRRGNDNKVSQLRKTALEQQSILDNLTQQQNELQNQEENLKVNKAHLKETLNGLENRLSAEGGTYAQRRPQLQQRMEVIQNEIEETVTEINSLTSGLLPFALAPKLCKKLSKQLSKEAELKKQAVIQNVWQERLHTLSSKVKTKRVWEGLNIDLETREVLESRLTKALYEICSETPDKKTTPIIHHLSQAEQHKLHEWITQAIYAVPQNIQILGAKLRALKEERSQIEEDLKRAPNDELLLPIHEEILRLEAAINGITAKQEEFTNQISVLQFRRDDLTRKMQKTTDQLYKIQNHQYQVELAESSKAVLKTYQDALIQQRLKALESALVTTFNKLCQKEHLIQNAKIHPYNFEIQLQNAEDHNISLNDFSAGEKQLYALSLLWALRSVSGWKLPIAIDTPLARLDEAHRWRILHHYIPFVSDQVILFATDAELDAGLLTEVQSHLTRIYHLNYNAQEQHTVCYHESFS